MLQESHHKMKSCRLGRNAFLLPSVFKGSWRNVTIKPACHVIVSQNLRCIVKFGWLGATDVAVCACFHWHNFYHIFVRVHTRFCMSQTRMPRLVTVMWCMLIVALVKHSSWTFLGTFVGSPNCVANIDLFAIYVGFRDPMHHSHFGGQGTTLDSVTPSSWEVHAQKYAHSSVLLTMCFFWSVIGDAFSMCCVRWFVYNIYACVLFIFILKR